jgi:hypothetical protein
MWDEFNKYFKIKEAVNEDSSDQIAKLRSRRANLVKSQERMGNLESNATRRKKQADNNKEIKSIDAKLKSLTKESKSSLKENESGDSEYKVFFKKALEKAGKSIPSMSDEEKKEFFNKIDSAWKGKSEKKEVNEAFGNDAIMAKLHSVLADKKFLAKATEDEFLSKVNGMTNGYFKSGSRNRMLKKVYTDYVNNPNGFKYDDSKYGLEESKSVKEAVSSNKVDAKSVASKMRNIKTMKAFADKVEKMGKVSEKDLHDMLPDYIAGGDIASVLKESTKIKSLVKKKVNESRAVYLQQWANGVWKVSASLNSNDLPRTFNDDFQDEKSARKFGEKVASNYKVKLTTLSPVKKLK